MKINQSKALEIQKKAVSDAVLLLIQNRVEKYNTDHGLTHNSVYSCNTEMYAGNPHYDHQQFCIDVGLWNTDVWMEVRRLQGLIDSGEMIPATTVEEFISLLPEYTGVK